MIIVDQIINEVFLKYHGCVHCLYTEDFVIGAHSRNLKGKKRETSYLFFMYSFLLHIQRAMF